MDEWMKDQLTPLVLPLGLIIGGVCPEALGKTDYGPHLPSPSRGWS